VASVPQARHAKQQALAGIDLDRRAEMICRSLHRTRSLDRRGCDPDFVQARPGSDATPV
jgi:hypothetical protein